MDKYDVVIIGSGLGGLECGYILAKEGYNVCILEKNRQLGGSLQTFSRDKVIFDTGVHYIGGLDEGQNLNQFFKYFELMDKLKLKRMDEDGFDMISFTGDPVEYPYAMGFENFKETLYPFFPKEKAAIDEYCRKILEVKNFFPLYNLSSKNAGTFDTRYLEVSASGFIDTLTHNKRLRQVLAGTNPLYAGELDRTPLYVHALVINTYLESAWKCVDGGSQISKYLARSIRQMGGTIKNYKKVVNLEFEGDEVSYAETDEGERFYGKKFISNVHPRITLGMLDNSKMRKSYTKRIKSLENSVSVFTLHLVFKENTFPYLNKNYYHYTDDTVWQDGKYSREDWPQGVAVFCPASSKSDKWAEGMNAMTYMDYEEVLQWEDSFHTIPRNINDRGEGYEAFTEDRSEKILKALEQKWPDIRSCIKSQYTSTPLSFRDYIGSGDGSLYGIKKDYRSPMRTFVSPKTKVKNLFFTGQNLNLHGLLGVTIASIVTCAEFVGIDYLMEKVKNAG